MLYFDEIETNEDRIAKRWEREDTLSEMRGVALRLGDGWIDALQSVTDDLFATVADLDSIERVIREASEAR